MTTLSPRLGGGRGPARDAQAKPASLARRTAELKRPASLAMRTAQSERAKRASARRQRVTVGGHGLPSGPSAGSRGGRPGGASIGRNPWRRHGLGVRRGFVSGHPPAANRCRGSQPGRLVGGGGGRVGGGASAPPGGLLTVKPSSARVTSRAVPAYAPSGVVTVAGCRCLCSWSSSRRRPSARTDDGRPRRRLLRWPSAYGRFPA
jgi:hypothetical protein